MICDIHELGLANLMALSFLSNTKTIVNISGHNRTLNILCSPRISFMFTYNEKKNFISYCSSLLFHMFSYLIAHHCCLIVYHGY